MLSLEAYYIKINFKENCMNKKWFPHIIAVMATTVFILLCIGCVSFQLPPIEERKASWLKLENNKFKYR